MEQALDHLAGFVRDIPDFPQPGVTYKDITPLLADHAAFASTIDRIAEAYRGRPVHRVVGIEARGFIVAAPVAYHFGAGFVPVRKKGKLPGMTHGTSYQLEYAEASIEVQHGAFAPGDRVLIVDDVLATGGTVEAAVGLVEAAGGHVVGVSVLLELSFLHGRERLGRHDVHALVTV